jgi:hypothetical protein
MNTNNKLRIFPKKETIPAEHIPALMKNPGLQIVQAVAVPTKQFATPTTHVSGLETLPVPATIE